jgi:general secretion pathway protein L
MLFELYEWWIGQLSDCIPKQWRRAASSAQDCLTITPVGSLGPNLATICISARTKNRETRLGEFAVKGSDLARLIGSSSSPIVLRLPDDDVLCKTITLPLATERDLAQVLSFEMDRETPFVVDEVFWAYRVVERDKQRGQLAVRLRLIGRNLLAPLLATLAEAGILVTRAEITGGADDGLCITLDTGSAQSKHRAGALYLRWVSASICIVLAVMAVAVPFVRQARDIARLDQEISAGRGVAEQAERLRHDIERLEGAGDVIKNERAAAGDPLAALAALTAALPDDTYLTELQQQQHKVTFGGRSAAASRLIGAVSKSDGLRNPVFVAPVTRMEATHTEVFSISAEMGP